MANIKSAQKRIRVIEKKSLVNKMRVSQIKTAIKKFELALENGDLALADESLRLAQKKMNRASVKGGVHKNTAARKISRLTKKLNAAKKAN